MVNIFKNTIEVGASIGTGAGGTCQLTILENTFNDVLLSVLEVRCQNQKIVRLNIILEAISNDTWIVKLNVIFNCKGRYSPSF